MLGTLILLTALSHAVDAAAPVVTASLEGHAILPATSFVQPPRGAPVDARSAGKFAGVGNLRQDRIGAVPATTASDGRVTGLALPFRGQAVQGISGLAPGPQGHYWALSDNGFGTRRNSPDALLAVHELAIDFERGSVRRERTIFLRDPDRRIAHRIVHDDSRSRYLTGADFDPESLQVIGDAFWIGDEFGPFLLEFDQRGVLRRLIEARLGDRVLRSPDHPALQLGATPGERVGFEVQRSGGFEALAQTPDGRRLWAVLEKPLIGADDRAESGFVRGMEFDPVRGEWTGRARRIPLAAGAVSVGDFSLLDERRGVLLERDGGEGSPRLACTANQRPPSCFGQPARHRHLVWIDLGNQNAESARRLQTADLLSIADPDGRAIRRGDGAPQRGLFDLPFATIECVLPLAGGRFLIGNDNNLPFSAARFLTRADDTEFVLIAAPAPRD